MADKIINIARDFSEFPTGRYQKHGEGSGEEFREKILLPILQKGMTLEVSLDGTVGYPSSFLEEAFGGLIRSGFTLERLHDLLTISHIDAAYKPYELLAWRFIKEESDRTLAKT